MLERRAENIKRYNKYLLGQASSNEIELLLAWVLSEDFKSWTEEQWKTSENSSFSFSDKRRQDLFKEIKNKIGESHSVVDQHQNRSIRLRLYTKIAKVAAVILLLVVSSLLTYYLTNVDNSLVETVVYAEKGQRANIVLPDGSRAFLNADSKIAYGKKFNAKERTVKIIGEVYFEVSKDSDRPFIVETDGLNVKVHGTSFNVNTYHEDDIKVSLIEGSVEVITNNQKRLMLSPDESAVYNIKTNALLVEKGNADYSIEWRFNRFRFTDESLISIMERLERTFNIEVDIKDSVAKNKRFTGDFSKNETIEQILEIMSSNNKFKYRMKGNKVEIY